MHRPALLWIASTYLALSGCSGTSAPRVDVVGASLGEVSDEGFVINFAVNLANPNNEPLQLTEMRYSVNVSGVVDGAAVYDGRRSAEATLSASGAKTVLVPAVFTFAQLSEREVPSSLPYTIRGELWYVAPGALAETLFDAGVQRPSISFAGEGTLHFEGEE